MNKNFEKCRNIKDFTVKSCCEARHGKGFEGMLNRYFAAELLKEYLKGKAEGLAKKLGL